LPTGICGATIDTVTARNMARHISPPGMAHSDHGRDLFFTPWPWRRTKPRAMKFATLRNCAIALTLELKRLGVRSTKSQRSC
jgi:hypothetical protein